MSKFPENSDGVNQANNKLTEIMCKAAKLSLTTKRDMSRNIKHKNPKNGLIRSERKRSEMLKEFKKICKDKQNEYWGKKNDKLFSNNDKNFWSVWKQCDENIASNKNPVVCDGEKWETYYAILFSNPIGKNNNLKP